ncbi:DUF1631 domain-containing protein [Luteimonas vadosa]|uniref:DUF1631 domain-containing protein n=2 Tax=Luteimonas vadosa TaxID=1165507 RepID=A0ABP9E0P8_9GAMM
MELDHSLRVLLDEFERELFRLADTARNPGNESAYMQTLRTFRMHRADLVPHLMVELEASVAAIRHKVAPAQQSESQVQGFQTLSLVEDVTLDEDVVLRDVAVRQEARSNLALHLLSQRFGVLAGTPAPDASRIPLGPQALCRALHHASVALEINLDARLLLYRLFDRHVMPAYGGILDKLDATMASDGILPGLTYVPIRARPTLQNPDPAAATPAERARAGAGRQADKETSSDDPGESREPARFRTGRASAQRTPPDRHRPHTAWLGEPDDVDDEMDRAEEETAYASLRQLMSGRRELLGKLRPSRRANARTQLDSLDLDDALAALQTQPSSPTGSARTLADIKQTLLAQARQQRGHGARLSQADEDTFELLNMLYSQIEGEIDSEAPSAALLRRLQLPMLRVALHDGGFFVRGSHPARQLLNTVAETAAKWLDKEDFDPQLLSPLKQAVDDVVEKYDGDDRIFQDINQRLQKTLEANIRKAELLERRHVEAARGKEKLEVAKLRTSSTLAELVGDRRIPKFTRALLNQAWADVLTLTLLRHGEDSDEWQKQLEATRQIIEACGHSEERTEVDPALARHVESALSQVGYQGEEAGVIAQRLTSGISDDDDPASRTELAMKVKARARLGEEATTRKQVRLPPRTPAEQERFEQLRVMPFGTWIEFTTNQQGDVVRRRLSWYSPVTGHALFVNQRGQRVGEQSLDALARMLANGQARIVTAASGRLVDRAWQAAVKALRSFASRGDAAPEIDEAGA